MNESVFEIMSTQSSYALSVSNFIDKIKFTGFNLTLNYIDLFYMCVCVCVRGQIVEVGLNLGHQVWQQGSSLMSHPTSPRRPSFFTQL